MTVDAETAKSGPYSGNGSTTVFAYAFKALDQAHLVVTLTVTATGVEAIKSITTHYTVSGVGDDGGGNVTMVTAPAVGETLTITRAIPQTQTTDLVNRGAVQPAVIETALDRGVQMVQDFDEEMGRALTLPVSTNMSSVSSEVPAPVANAYLLWNTDATAITTTTSSAGQYLGGDGSVGAPFYSWSSDTNSGFYRIGSDQVGLSLNGTKHVDFSTSGAIFTGTVEAGGDTSASDNAAMGYTAAEGLILTGQGSTNDVTIKNDADAIALEVPTGTQNVNMLGNLVLTGDLTVNGSTVTNSVTNQVIADPLIELNNGAGSNANDLGFIFERGSTGDNCFLGWDESGDYFTVGTTSATGSSTGNITYSFAPFKCSAITATSGTLAGITSLGLNAGATITAGILDEDAMGSDSAVALATQQSIKAYVDNNAPEAGVKFAFESTTTDTDQGAGKVFLNHASPASATVLYVDDVEAGGVSVNAWVDTWDDVSNAVAKGYVYIASYGTTNAILVYKVTGSVVSASTYSKVPVSHILTVGTISDGDSIGLTFVPSGADGAGDLTAANNLSDVASASTSLANLGGTTEANAVALALALG